jgi:hypothetical protein
MLNLYHYFVAILRLFFPLHVVWSIYSLVYSTEITMLASRVFPPKENEDSCILERDALYSGRWSPMFWRKCCRLFRVEKFPEDGVSMFSQNVGNDLPDYTVSYPRRQQSSCSPP